MSSVADRTDVAQQHAARMSDRFEWIGRAGWAAKGVVYGLIGVLFLQIAWLGGASEEASQKGPLKR